jgi:uncharacterized protein (TIGR02391 family)
MAKRTQPPEEIPPSLTKKQGRHALFVMAEKGKKLLDNRPIPEAAFATWYGSTIDYIKKTFGSFSPHVMNFVGEQQIQFGDPGERYKETLRANHLNHGINILVSLIEQIDTEMELESPIQPSPAAPDDSFWSLIHAKVISAAKARFDAAHYADAVEAALKELNTVVKEMVKKKTGQELDGAPLMLKAFSPNLPVLVSLDDISTESGRNIQQGYMQIFAGAMTGIRNPKAHENVTITRERAIHFLFLSSLLFYKLDERP